MLPVIHLKNGEGHRAMISAGVHGDEYEVQIALRKLALELSAEEITGSLIVLPAANILSVAAARRTSNLDDGNLNRLFPGDPSGQPTAMIAHAIEHLLLAGCDFAYDIHSGGSSLLYDALAVITKTGNEKDDTARSKCLQSLGLPSGMVLSASLPMGLDATLEGAMLRQKVIGFSSEFGGCGKIDDGLLCDCQNSIQGFLAYCGLIESAFETVNSHATELFDVNHPSAHLYCDKSGVFEPLKSVGETIKAGDVLCMLYDLEDYNKLALPLTSEISGKILCSRPMPMVQKGDCLFQIGQPMTF